MSCSCSSCGIRIIAGKSLEERLWVPCVDSFACLNHCMVEHQLSNRQPAYSIQQLLLAHSPATELTHCSSCQQLLNVQWTQKILLCTSPKCNQVCQLTHDDPICHLQLGFKTCSTTHPYQTIDSAIELLHQRTIMISKVKIPLKRLVQLATKKLL